MVKWQWRQRSRACVSRTSTSWRCGQVRIGCDLVVCIDTVGIWDPCFPHRAETARGQAVRTAGAVPRGRPVWARYRAATRLAQFLAVCRRSQQVMSMDTRRHCRGLGLSRRCALPRRGDTLRLRQGDVLHRVRHCTTCFDRRVPSRRAQRSIVPDHAPS